MSKVHEVTHVMGLKVLYGMMLGFGELYGYVGSICLLESTPQSIRGTAYGVAAGKGALLDNDIQVTYNNIYMVL